MDITDFQKHAVSTLAIKQKGLPALSHRGFGLIGEAGHVVHIIKKTIRDREGVATDQDIAEIKKRLGDVLYYAAVIADYYDLDLGEIAEQNMAQSTAFKQKRLDSKDTPAAIDTD